MTHLFRLAAILFALCILTTAYGNSLNAAELFPGINANDWAWWRGPNLNGHAPATAKPPTKWNSDSNIKWKTPIVGRGHSTPTIVGDRIYLSTTVEEKGTRHVIAIDRANGKQLWSTEVYQGKLDHNHPKNSYASPSIACDGERLFCAFDYEKAVWLWVLDLKGNVLRQHRVAPFTAHQGYSASPHLYKSLVIVAADSKGEGEGYLVAYDRESGDEVWRTKRPSAPSYVSPVVQQINGKDVLLMAGCDMVAAYDAASGKVEWEAKGAATTECVGTLLTDGKLVFSSGGYPKHETTAVLADGSGKVAWRVPVRIYVPSMILIGDYLYAVADPGIVYCWHKDTGEEQWKHRLGGTFSTSPVLANGLVYVSDEQANTYVLRLSPEKLEVVAKNQLGTHQIAGASFSGKQLFLRSATEADARQEYLYCVEE